MITQKQFDTFTAIGPAFEPCLGGEFYTSYAAPIDTVSDVEMCNPKYIETSVGDGSDFVLFSMSLKGAINTLNYVQSSTGLVLKIDVYAPLAA